MDAYVWRARFQPALLVILPGALAGIAWFTGADTWPQALGSILVFAGVPTLLAELGRDRGKRMEVDLFRAWGGKPTTCALRWRSAENPVILERRHRKLQELLPDVQLPTLEEEVEDPDRADQVYEACAAFLRERTRDRSQFRLIFAENCSYGFRRNLWGMKPIGVVVSCVGLLTSVLGAVLAKAQGSEVVYVHLIAALGGLGMLIAWAFLITPSWVRTPAESYAARLLGACDQL